MAEFKVRYFRKPKIKNAVLISGLPGIGNVGKIAVDFMIDSLKARKIVEIFSYSFPHSVFVNEHNMVDLPVINIYHAKSGKRNILLLAGDIQPTDEISCYTFCDKVIEIFSGLGGGMIITLGGIGLSKIPKEPEVYITGTSKKLVNSFSDCAKGIYGVVGPIVGVTGILLGLAGRKKIDAVSLLAQTFGHPSYFGIKGSRAILKILAKNLKIKLNISRLDSEIEEIEQEIKRKTQQLQDLKKATKGESKGLTYFG